MENAGEARPGQGGRWPWENVEPIPAQQHDRRMPGQSLPTPVLMVLVGAVPVIGFLLWAFVASDQDNRDLERFNQEYYCERYAEPGDPDCW